MSGGPETALGLDDLFDPQGDVVEHRVEVERLANPGKAVVPDVVFTVRMYGTRPLYGPRLKIFNGQG
jgi:hypothetical protein